MSQSSGEGIEYDLRVIAMTLKIGTQLIFVDTGFHWVGV
jgi:hypothetical protein